MDVSYLGNQPQTGGVILQKAIVDSYSILGVNYTSASTTVVATGIALTITPQSTGNYLDVFASIPVACNVASQIVELWLYVDGSPVAGLETSFRNASAPTTTYGSVTIQGRVPVSSLSAKTFEIYAKTYAGTLTIFANANSAASISVEEVSPNKITPSGAIISGIYDGIAATSLSGVSVDLTSIPALAKRINIHMDGGSTNGVSSMIMQLGDSGGLEATGYVGSVSHHAGGSSAFTTAFELTAGYSAAHLTYGTISLEKASGDTWILQGNLATNTGGYVNTSAGRKTLTGTLDKIRLTTGNGTDVYDAGTVFVTWEF